VVLYANSQGTSAARSAAFTPGKSTLATTRLSLATLFKVLLALNDTDGDAGHCSCTVAVAADA
jgi:hypothetical protein